MADEHREQTEGESVVEGTVPSQWWLDLKVSHQRLRKALEQIADDEYVPGPTTSQWLVERGQPEGEENAVWLEHTGLHPASEKRWTRNAWDAAMFTTQKQAEEWIAEHELEARAVSHGFMSRLEPREIAREALGRA